LLAANACLLARRRSFCAAKVPSTPPFAITENGSDIDRRPSPIREEFPVAVDFTLPDHLGWGSAGLTAVLRPQPTSPPNARARTTAANRAHSPCTIPAPQAAPRPIQIPPRAFAAALLRTGTAAAGRVWLLGRQLDAPGRGMLPVAELQTALCDKSISPLHLRQATAAQSAAAGDGAVVDAGQAAYIWLFSPVRAAAALGVEGTGRPPRRTPPARPARGRAAVPRLPVRRLPRRAGKKAIDRRGRLPARRSRRSPAYRRRGSGSTSASHAFACGAIWRLARARTAERARGCAVAAGNGRLYICTTAKANRGGRAKNISPGSCPTVTKRS
jgi:hypothetical protein